MKLRCTVVYDYELTDNKDFLIEHYGTTDPAEIAEINRSRNEAVDMIVTLDELEASGAEDVRQVRYTIEPVTLADDLLGDPDG